TVLRFARKTSYSAWLFVRSLARAAMVDASNGAPGSWAARSTRSSSGPGGSGGEAGRLARYSRAASPHLGLFHPSSEGASVAPCSSVSVLSSSTAVVSMTGSLPGGRMLLELTECALDQPPHRFGTRRNVGLGIRRHGEGGSGGRDRDSY